MDLKISSINFQGKKEVLYALTKAAQKAKNYEYYAQPAIASRCKSDTLQVSNNASMQAYLDMALRDSDFKNVVKNGTDKDFSFIRKLLAPEQTQHSYVEPMKKFSEAVNEVINNNYGGKAWESMLTFSRELLQKLKLQV